MRYKNNYFVAEDIKTKKITYGFFSKEGGCSKGNYDSLNCSQSSGDNKKLVTYYAIIVFGMFIFTKTYILAKILKIKDEKHF